MNNLGGKPKFKKKNCMQSYQTNYTNNNIEVLDDFIKLPKLGKVKAKVLGDISISKFINMLEYKARWYGRKLIKVNRYYPSSQLCNCCGYQNKELKDYSIRTWECPCCGNFHSRDYDAANNILGYWVRITIYLDNIIRVGTIRIYVSLH